MSEYWYFANGFHNSTARVRITGEITKVSGRTMRRVERELCGNSACLCYTSMASKPRDHQPVGCDGYAMIQALDVDDSADINAEYIVRIPDGTYHPEFAAEEEYEAAERRLREYLKQHAA